MGGAGLTIVEASAVTPEGRIAPGDVGIWGAQHIAPHARLAAAIARVGSVPGITLGSWAAKAVPEGFLRVLLAMTLAGVALKLIY